MQIAANSFQARSTTCVKDYFLLLKPRVMSLVVFTGIVGMYLAPGEIHPFIAVIATLLIALGSGAAGAINMWYERDLDAGMKRTMKRPIPDGRIPADSALEFAVICAIASVLLMAMVVNYLSAALLLASILFYVFVYTIWLKQRTPLNIVIGGAAGAMPPVIGWAAVTNSVAMEQLILFAIIFMWTPPHFWALALVKSGEYDKVGIPMMPSVAGRKSTLRQMLVYTLILTPLSTAPYFMGGSGIIYFAGSIMLGAGFVAHALRMFFSKDNTNAMSMFAYSIFYLSAIFLLLVIDKLIQVS